MGVKARWGRSVGRGGVRADGRRGCIIGHAGLVRCWVVGWWVGKGGGAEKCHLVGVNL